MTVVPYAAIQRAERDWDEQSDVLHSASRNLDQAEVAALGPRVSPAAARFVETWRTELDEMKAAAISHSRALAVSRMDFLGTDRERADEMRDLVPWADRGPGAGGPGAAR